VTCFEDVCTCEIYKKADNGDNEHVPACNRFRVNDAFVGMEEDP